MAECTSNPRGGKLVFFYEETLGEDISWEISNKTNWESTTELELGTTFEGNEWGVVSCYTKLWVKKVQ